MVDRFTEIRQAQLELERFLAENPELQPTQDAIERACRGNSAEDNLRGLMFTITENLYLMRTLLKELQKKLPLVQ